jgi:signal peptidase II
VLALRGRVGRGSGGSLTDLLRTRRLELVLVVAIIVLDQLTKAMVRQSLPLHDSIEVIPGFLSLTRVHNTGAAFGMLNSVEFPFKTVVMTLVAMGALAGVSWYAATVPLTDRLARAGIAAVVGGAIGNLIDRASAGYVLDFVDAYWRGWHFWAFNVADAAITLGVIGMILDILGLGRRVSNPV